MNIWLNKLSFLANWIYFDMIQSYFIIYVYFQNSYITSSYAVLHLHRDDTVQLEFDIFTTRKWFNLALWFKYNFNGKCTIWLNFFSSICTYFADLLYHSLWDDSSILYDSWFQCSELGAVTPGETLEPYIPPMSVLIKQSNMLIDGGARIDVVFNCPIAPKLGVAQVLPTHPQDPKKPKNSAIGGTHKNRNNARTLRFGKNKQKSDPAGPYTGGTPPVCICVSRGLKTRRTPNQS